MTDVRELDEFPELLSAAIDSLTRSLAMRATSARLLGGPVAPLSPLTAAGLTASPCTCGMGMDEIPSASDLCDDHLGETVTPTPWDGRRREQSACKGMYAPTRPLHTSVGERLLRDRDGDAASPDTASPDAASLRIDGRADILAGHCRAAMDSQRWASGGTNVRPWCRN